MAEFSTHEEAKKKLCEKASKDAAFQESLFNDPKGIIEKELGIKIPDGIELNVHKETMKSIHIVIPVGLPDGDSLSEEQLEAVSGGQGYFTDCYSCVP